MNISAISTPGAAALATGPVPAESGQAFAQQLGAVMLLPAPPAGETLPASPPTGIAPLIPAMEGPQAIPMAPETLVPTDEPAIMTPETISGAFDATTMALQANTEDTVNLDRPAQAGSGADEEAAQPAAPLTTPTLVEAPGSQLAPDGQAQGDLAFVPLPPSSEPGDRETGLPAELPTDMRDAAPDAAAIASGSPTVVPIMAAMPLAPEASASASQAPAGRSDPALARTNGAAEGATAPAGAASTEPASPEITTAVRTAPPLEDHGSSAPPAGVAPSVSAFASRLAEAYPAASAPPPTPVVEARTGMIGREMGVEIARQLAAGKEELTVRLNPAEMGRVEVRLGFDDGGSLRAVVAAESPAALDLLRRDAGDLARALADAGVRSDAHSFRFDTRGGDGGQAGQRWQHQPRRDPDGGEHQASDPEAPAYRPLRTSGRIDLFA